MVHPADDRFPKSARLRKRAEYLSVQGQGRKLQTRAYLALALEREDDGVRLGITTSRRLGGAVVRNRARRLVREAFRRGVLAVPPGTDLIVIPKAAALCLTAAQLFRDLQDLGRRLERARGRRS
ncbi:MAG TPA: ribonuclease P protein component [Phycisphaerae bacterium]|nr:ribonuclease P protein component [Phycisphaerae bacterium]